MLAQLYSMKRVEIIKMLEKCPIFSINEFARITGKGAEYSRLYLHRLKKDGLVCYYRVFLIVQIDTL